MCNQAGYLGDQPAAPVLLAMMERQQGFAGGYYSGLATLDAGRLRYTKVVGDFSRIRSETNAEKLPGTIGIAHSRSNSGGDVEWGHPFVDCRQRLAYVANGHLGLFEHVELQNKLLRELEAGGHHFRSRSQEMVNRNGKAPVLADGSSVHLSELMCHLIESLVEEHGPAEAMRRAYSTYPAEIAGILLHTDLPDCLVATRISQPLVLGRGPHGVYVATTALAFDFAEVTEWYPLPPCTTAVISRDRIELLPLDPLPGEVSPHLPWVEGVDAVVQLLSDGEPHGLGELLQPLASLWPETVAPQKYRLCYEILEGLAVHGRLEFDDVEVPGAFAETPGIRRRTRLLV